MSETKTVTVNNKLYQLVGKNWVDIQTYQVPPLHVVQYLNAELIKETNTNDINLTPKELYKRAMTIRDSSPSLAIEMLRKVLEKWPDHIEVSAALAAILRKGMQPEEALKVTEKFKNAKSPMIYTVRAAALCDLEKWAEAKKEIGIALAIGRSPEAFNVVSRIKKVKPELYNS